MARKFVATILTRDTVEDVFANGAVAGTETSNEENEADIVADTLPDLIKKLSDTYQVSNGAITLTPDCNDTIILTRHETKNGNRPTKHVMELWEEGKNRLLLVDYTIRIRVAETVDFSKMSDAELALAGISG